MTNKHLIHQVKKKNFVGHNDNYSSFGKTKERPSQVLKEMGTTSVQNTTTRNYSQKKSWKHDYKLPRKMKN